jgi:ABC-type multidrug transport system ATPase subunit
LNHLCFPSPQSYNLSSVDTPRGSPSGSGKTSLTSVVAGLVDPTDVTEGKILVNGEEGKIPKQMVGVVWQDDLLLSNLTVEETIYFAARLKTPKDTTDEEVRMLVRETMNELGLFHVRDHLIGSSTSNQQRTGISGGERKRTAVAAELVVRPSLLLLDEPTSGLDATTARSLMTTLKDLTSLGHSIAVVIHQPRTDIFKMIDNLLLLSKGRVVYNGSASCVRQYLETVPGVESLPLETGIADWIMDVVIADEGLKEYAKLANNWASTVKSNKEKAMITCSTNDQTSEVTTHRAKSQVLEQRMSTLTELHQTPKKYEASFWKQLSLLTSRTIKQRRGERLTRVAVMLTFAYTLFTALFWWQMPNTTSWIFERNSLLFFMLIAQGNGIVMGSISVFQRERALLRRDRAKKLYGVLPFFIAKTASDMTNNILLPCCYGIITYWTAGLRPTAGAFFKFLLGYYLTLSCAQSMGFFLSILIPSMTVAMILAPPITLFFFIIGGFYIPLSNMHVGIKWASYISFARYGYSSLLVNEFQGRDIPCSEDDVAISIGEITECPLPGDSVYESVGIEGVFANYWFNIVIMAILQAAFLIGAYGLLRKSK